MQKTKIKSALELLNFYRNCHYNAPSGTQEYALANAINDILPLVSQLRNMPEHDRTCPNCNADIQKSWGFCPQCGTHVLPAPPGDSEVVQ